MAADTSEEPTETATRPAAGKAGDEPKLLSGGNPQIPKGDGEAPVRAYLSAMPSRGRRLR